MITGRSASRSSSAARSIATPPAPFALEYACPPLHPAVRDRSSPTRSPGADSSGASMNT